MSDQLVLFGASDPDTSRAAARGVADGKEALERAIHDVLREHGPLTHFEIAGWVDAKYPQRWDEGTIRAACARARLKRLPYDGMSPRGNRCSIWALAIEDVHTGGVL